MASCSQDAEQTKSKLLQRQVNRERKGALRELKRDSVFLEHAKAKKIHEIETRRFVVVGNILHFDITGQRFSVWAGAQIPF